MRVPLTCTEEDNASYEAPPPLQYTGFYRDWDGAPESRIYEGGRTFRFPCGWLALGAAPDHRGGRIRKERVAFNTELSMEELPLCYCPPGDIVSGYTQQAKKQKGLLEPFAVWSLLALGQWAFFTGLKTRWEPASWL